MVAIAPLHRPRHFMPELVVTHAEELAYLWGRRRAAVFSETLTLRDLQQLQERIDAHLQGMLVAGAELPALLGDWLAAADRDEVFAIAWALLRGGDAAQAAIVADAFLAASGSRLDGLRDALGAAPQTHTEAALRNALASSDAARAAAAAAALAGQRRLTAADLAANAPFAHLLVAEDAAVAALAWRSLALVDAAVASAPPPYREALRRPQPALREAALATACWRGETWAAQAARQLAEAGDALGFAWWAAVGDTAAASWPTLLAARPPAERCALLARAGHADGIETLLALMEDADPQAAAAAGTAFTRLTGLDVDGSRHTLPVSADADDFEREFANDVWLPDAARARQAWERHGERWRAGRRWCRGHEVSATLSSAAQATIDLAARWDFGMRAALAGARLMAPPPVL